MWPQLSHIGLCWRFVTICWPVVALQHNNIFSDFNCNREIIGKMGVRLEVNRSLADKPHLFNEKCWALALTQAEARGVLFRNIHSFLPMETDLRNQEKYYVYVGPTISYELQKYRKQNCAYVKTKLSYNKPKILLTYNYVGTSISNGIWWNELIFLMWQTTVFV